MTTTTETPAAPAVVPPDLAARLEIPAGPRLRVLMGRYTGPRDIEGQLRKSEQLAKARTAIPRQYRENPGDILALMEHAMALDISLSVAWDNLHFNPEGVGGMRARLMHALLIRAGHHVQPVHYDDKIVRMMLHRTDGMPSGGAQWSLAEAIRNRLPEKDRSAWHGYSGDMLWARCLSRLARRWAPDVVLGFYAAEELSDIGADHVDEGLDPADMSMAMRDADGHLTPAPDVVKLLSDADPKNLDQLRHLWKRATEEGLTGAYAGTVDGVMLTVRDLLFDLMSHAETAQPRTPQGVPLTPVQLDQVVADATAAADPAADSAAAEVEADAAADAADLGVDDQPAGTGGKLECGCWSEAVAATGSHEPDCKRPPL
jgi:hypothetical protein